MNAYLISGACTALLATSLATAASTAELSIHGQLTPPACTIGFNGDAAIDFDTRTFGSLESNGTQLSPQRTDLHISCGGPTRVAFSAQDNRPGAGIARIDDPDLNWPTQHASNADRYSWGLGYADEAHEIKVGALIVLLKAIWTSVDGVNLTALADSNLLARAKGDATWPVQSLLEDINLSPTYEYSFGSKEGAAQAITDAQVGLQLSPLVGRPATLPTHQDIALDGSITFTLRYL